MSNFDLRKYLAEGKLLKEADANLEYFVKNNDKEIAKAVKAVRIENVSIIRSVGFTTAKDSGTSTDVAATGVFNVGNGDKVNELESVLAFRFPEDVDDSFKGVDGDKPELITIAGKQLMYVDMGGTFD